MRIISGKKRGALLDCPEGGALRPSADRVREGLFNILASGRYGDVLASPVIADIFAGVGSLGLEAWSRGDSSGGARHIIFIEKDRRALAALNRNIEKLEAGDAAIVLGHDATARINWPVGQAGLIFMDPPWIRTDDDDDLALMALENLIAHDAVADGALVSIEHDHRRPAALPDGVALLEVRKWGKVACTLARYQIRH
jgi:16S rRNA (guanine966-N2)-methyltransferase